MSTYSQQILKAVVASVCKRIGWQSITASALEILVDVLDRYLKEICRVTHDYTEHYNRTEGNLVDLELAFRDIGVNMNEIIEYISYVDPILPALDVPKFPVSKESHFNFLKPGSKEVLTRPVHIHEHLPPLNPPEHDEQIYNGEKEIDVVGLPGDDLFKRPATDGNPESAKKIKLEEEGRATREISSVMMTTSGFISPAREGKLPESRPPKLPDEFPKPVPPPMISPPFKSKDAPSVSGVDKKLEKKLKKKNHDKEKRHKEKYSTPDPVELTSYEPPNVMPQPILPREANEQMLLAERKKELKKLKMKSKEVVPKKKKEKPPKMSKTSHFPSGSIEKAVKFDPFQVLPSTLQPQLPPTSSQIQAHNFLTGAAHSGLFPSQMMDPNPFSQQLSLINSAQNPLIEGKLVSEPDKQKLNIFKKISKPKEDVAHKNQGNFQSQIENFLSPAKLDRLDIMPSTSSSSIPPHSFTDPIKKLHKLPKETTLTRIDDNNLPMNLSGISSRSAESSFEELAVPKTPTIPKTPDIKVAHNIEKKEKKERKKKEKKIEQPDWNQQQFPNPFDLLTQNNPFLQNLPGNLPNSFMSNRNPFSLPANDIFSAGPGLIPRTSFNMTQQMNQMVNSYGFQGMDMNQMVQKPAKKVKAPKQPALEDFLQMGSKFCNVAPLVPPSVALKHGFDPQSLLTNIPETFPLQQHSNMSNTATFDQLMKEQSFQQTPATPSKKSAEEKMETFDLTKDSSPEPVMNVLLATITSSTQQPEILPIAHSTQPTFLQQENVSLFNADQQQLQPQQTLSQPSVVKEKSKEKKRKKNKEEKKKKKKEKKKKKDKHKEKHRASMSTVDSQSNDTEDTADNSTSSVPKLMLKLNSPRPNTPDAHKKTLLHRARNDEFDFPSPHHQDMSASRDEPHTSGFMRDPSPELVRISPLVTRPPKQKQSTSIYPIQTGETHNYQHSNYQYANQFVDQPGTFQMQSNYSSYPQSMPQFNYQQNYQSPASTSTQQYNMQDSYANVQQYQMPQPQHNIDFSNAEHNNQSWNISKNRSSYIDADGSTVWICPACGSIDDGTPMIGCDLCDAWYHWACVGIKVEPKDDEDWFCRQCISRKQNEEIDGKKKKRKKKDKESRKEH